MTLSARGINHLEECASLVRQDIIEMIAKAGSGHPGGSLGITDILVGLYFKILRCKPKDPNWPERDRLILSHGHVCPALYSVLARAGYFPESLLSTFRELGSPLQGHPHRGVLPGIETTSGPLGSGLSQAVGMALIGKVDESTHDLTVGVSSLDRTSSDVGKPTTSQSGFFRDKRSWRVICLMSDGEQDEGNTWEGVMLAAKNKLDNLVGLVDRNGIQVDGKTEDVMPLNSLKSKYEAFGWKVLEIDGHDFNQIISAFAKASQIKGKPTLILAKTIPGKGVRFMEGKVEWHSHVISEEEKTKALTELKKYVKS